MRIVFLSFRIRSVVILPLFVLLSGVWLAGEAALQTVADIEEASQAVEPGPVMELLRDPGFKQGIRPPTNGSNREGLGSTCFERWRERLPPIAFAHWQFVTVAVNTRFCDNLETPYVDGSRIVYSSKDGSKRLEIDRLRSGVRFVFDTDREWRHGCNLSLAQDGRQPSPLSGHAWNWFHFLLHQELADPNEADGKLHLGEDRKAMLRFRAELKHSTKSGVAPCAPGTWGEQHIPDHCLFYVALVMTRDGSGMTSSAAGAGPARIYALVPLFYSTTGDRHDDSCAPWLGGDPAQDAVYFAPGYAGLAIGRIAEIAIDAGALVAGAVLAINAQRNVALAPDAYVVESILIGWEVWGAYACDLLLSDLSFRLLPAVLRVPR